jgi:hypothetical protein
VRPLITASLWYGGGLMPDGFFADWDDAMGANLAAVIAAQDAVILGRRSGQKLLDGLPSIRLESLRSTTSPAGYLLADYRVIG